MKYYAYEDFRIDTRTLLRKVAGFEPEVVVGIARGGLTLAHGVAEGLEVRDVESIRTELYDGMCKREEITIFGSCVLDGKKRVLVVDDIADSGETLKAVLSSLKKEHGDVEFKSATLFYKKSSVIEPDFWVNEATEWIEFFWESDFTNFKTKG